MNKPLLLAWVTALFATIGSLYFSEVRHFIPCTLCWYQRIFMYPLAIILGIAFYRNDKDIDKYTLPLAIIGVFISSYHTALQKIPYLQQFEMCKTGIPCSKDYLNWWGFLTMPMMALAAFIIIIICLVILRKQRKKEINE